MSLATDNVRPSAHPNRWRVGRLTGARAFMGLGQLMFSVAILATGQFVMKWNQRTLQSLVFLTIVCCDEATTYINRDRLRIWYSAPGRWLVGATVIDTAFVSGPAVGGIAMATLRAPAVAAIVVSAVAFAFVIDFAKVPVFKRLAFA